MWKFRSALNSMAGGVGVKDHALSTEDAKLLIYGSEAERLAQLTAQYPDIETGGDLFGYWTHSGSPVVSFAIGPGRSSRHHFTSFYQDETYLREVGTELYDQHGRQRRPVSSRRIEAGRDHHV